MALPVAGRLIFGATRGRQVVGVARGVGGRPGGTGAARGGVVRLPVKETWGNPRTLARHFRDHGADFGAQTGDEYARLSSEFLQRSQVERLPTQIDADGTIRVYDPSTNTFAYKPDGTTRTFFKPKRGTDYWHDQPRSASREFAQ